MAANVMSMCDSCGKHSIYRCPGCSVRSCSVPCVKQHKINHGCSGKRQRTAFVNMKDFKEANLVSDLHLLEETSRKIRVVSDAKSDVSPLITDPHYTTLRCNRNVLAKLKKAAELRNIDLKLCPFLSTRRRANSTHCNCRSVHQVTDCTKMFWHIKWIYGLLEYEERSVSEEHILIDLLAQFFNTSATGDIPPSTEFLLMRSKVREDCKAKDLVISDFKVVMKVEDSKNPSNFHDVDLSLSLLDNIRGKTIIEHPVFEIQSIQNVSEKIGTSNDSE